MARQKKINEATEADWGFTTNAEVMATVEYAARRAAREFELVEFDDAQQDAFLWLAVRPERVAKAHAEHDYRSLSQDIYSHALREPAISAAEWASVSVSKDAVDYEREGGQ